MTLCGSPLNWSGFSTGSRGRKVVCRNRNYYYFFNLLAFFEGRVNAEKMMSHLALSKPAEPRPSYDNEFPEGNGVGLTLRVSRSHPSECGPAREQSLYLASTSFMLSSPEMSAPSFTH